MKDVKQRILGEILKEREAQDVKWGEQNHKPIEWVAILTEEVGEVSAEALELHFDHAGNSLERYRAELVQVAAVALAMLECLERGEF